MKKIVQLIIILSAFSCSLGNNNLTNFNSIIKNDPDFKSVKNLVYMGGSVFYNPDSPNTGHLYEGIYLAVRLGKIKMVNDNNYQIIYDDEKEKALFGYIKVNSISRSNISFSYKLYDYSGNEVYDSSESLSIDSECDLDHDQIPDIKYFKPQVSRDELKSIVYLSFLSSKENLTTAMFSVLLDNYTESSYPGGVIGINPNDKFIFSKISTGSKSINSRIIGASRGDYIFNSDDGSYQVIKNNIKGKSITSDDVDTITDITEVDFTFKPGEFNIDLMPQLLINQLPIIISNKYSGGTDIDSGVTFLNELLSNISLIRTIIENQQISIPDINLQQIYQNINNLSSADVIKINRVFLQDTYSNVCPMILSASNDITTILPLLSCSFGEEDNNIQESGIENKGISKAESFSEYNIEKSAIEKKYKAYTSFYVYSPSYTYNFPISVPTPIPGSITQSQSAGITLTNSSIKLGLKGTFNITYSSLRSSINGAIFIQGDSNFTIKGSYSFKLADYQIPITKITVPIIGPICLNIVPNVGFSIPLTVTATASQSFDARASFIGLYGAGAVFNADWYIDWETWWLISYPVPHISCSISGNLVNETSYYIGCDSVADTAFNNAAISLYPNISGGLEVNLNDIIYGNIKATTGINNQISVKIADDTLIGTAKINFVNKLSINTGIKITIPIIGKRSFNKEIKLLDIPSMTLAEWELFRNEIE